MAESIAKATDEETGNNVECAVCLQICIHPAQLPCGHIFCFLCVKGIANQSKRCAMCRQEIPRDFIDNPKLLDNCLEMKETNDTIEGGYQWFYEGRNGWWQYDERTSKELEASYKTEERTCELLIAGFLYVADFDSMVQRRHNDPSKRRRIKRDLCTIPRKGIAGIKILNDVLVANEHSESSINNDSNYLIPTATPEEIYNPSIETESQDVILIQDSLQSTIEQMQSLNLISRDSSDSEQDTSSNMNKFSNTFVDAHKK